MRKIFFIFFCFPLISFSEDYKFLEIGQSFENHKYENSVILDYNSSLDTIFGCTDTLAFNYDLLANVDDSSCCYYFNSYWNQIGQDIDGEAIGDRSGQHMSISADGNIVAIGAIYNNGINGPNSGHVRIYENISGNWIQIGQDIDGEYPDDVSSWQLSLSSDGTTIAIGSMDNSDGGLFAGHVRVYENLNGSWSQVGQDIDGENANDRSGYSVSINSDGTVVAIGAPENDGNGNQSGHVRIYENISGTWSQIGQDINGENIGDLSHVVSINSDGTVVAIGAPENDDNGNQSGHVRIYENISGTWNQIGQDINGENIGDLANVVSINADGTIIAIGAEYNDGNGNRSGHVRVYQIINGNWAQIGQDIDGEEADDFSGQSLSLSLDGNIIAIGASLNDGNGNKSGHVRVYQIINGNWVQIGQDINGEAPNDQSGTSVSISSDGKTVAIGAPYNNTVQGGNGLNGTNTGHVRVFHLINTCDILGCLDTNALNYNSLVTVDDGSCIYLSGCTDSLAYNFLSSSIVSDSSCLYCNLTNIFYTNSNTTGNCNGFIIANSSSSHSPITYLWSNGSTGTYINNLCGGIYSVIITDSVGCVIEDTIYFNVNYGCTDSLALNYNLSANTDDSSCVYCVYGCMDILACNYDYSATCNDGSCLTVYGCTDSLSFNYDILAGCDDGSCLPFFYGCLDSLSLNYNSLANTDDGSCLYCVYGCMDTLSCNYDSLATCDDGSCLTVYGCTDSTSFNYDFLATCDDGNCLPFISGCTDSLALNYDISANTDDGSCLYCFFGCMDTLACNYDSLATCDDGGCLTVYGCTDSASFNYDFFATCDDGNCFPFIYGCTDSLGLNYDLSANTDDGSCLYCVYGCMDTLACNYDPLSNCDNGSCLTVYGCTDSLAFNYDSSTTCDDGSCLICDLTTSFYVVQNTPGNCNGIIIASSFSFFNSVNYLWSDGSTTDTLINLCEGTYSVSVIDSLGCSLEDTIYMGIYFGCTDSLATNYDSIANTDDASCLYCGCTNSDALNYDSLAICDDGSCIIVIYGCTDSLAINYFSGATIEDGSCIYSGCLDTNALNFDALATIDDSSCQYLPICMSPIPEELNSFDVIDTRAVIDWRNMNDSACMVFKYFIRYREVGTNSWNTKSAGVGNGLCIFGLNTVTKQLLNLSPSTLYEFKMKAFYCGGTSSNYSQVVQFTTSNVCPDMNNLSVQTFNNNTSKAKFTWDSTGVYTFARILLRVDTAGANWQTAGGFGVYYPTLFVNKFGLQSGQSYRAQGRMFCDSNITTYRSPTWTSLIFWSQPAPIRLNGGVSINNLDVYPNPSSDLFNISFSSDKIQDLSIRILSVVGAEVYRENKQQFVGEYTKQISLDNYGKGIYFLEIETNEGVINKKLILH